MQSCSYHALWFAKRIKLSKIEIEINLQKLYGSGTSFILVLKKLSMGLTTTILQGIGIYLWMSSELKGWYA